MNIKTLLNRPLADMVKHAPIMRVYLERSYRRVFAAASGNQRIFFGVYPSWQAAAEAAPKSKEIGYDREESAELEPLERFGVVDYPAVFWLSRLIRNGARTVFDWGGHRGVAYYSFRQFFEPLPPDFHWLVCEVPAVARSGQRVADQKGERHISFTDDMLRADGCDVLFSTGALQLIPTELTTLLPQLNRPPRYLVINMVPMTQGETYFTINNIGPAFCPYRIKSRPALLKELEVLGYRLLADWDLAAKSLRIPFHSEKDVDAYQGMVFERMQGN